MNTFPINEGETLAQWVIRFTDDALRQQLRNEIVSGLPRWRWQQFDAAKDYHE